MTVPTRSETNLYLLQRRGRMKLAGGKADRAIIVGAISEAHARVQAYGRSNDLDWAEDSHTTCRRLVVSDGMTYTIYAAVDV